MKRKAECLTETVQVGRNYFFLASEVKATVFGRLACKSIRRVLKRIFVKVRELNFNCLEVTKIVEQRFLGVPYVTVCAHSRHIQQGSLMELRKGFKN